MCLQLSPMSQSVLNSLGASPSAVATKSHRLPKKASRRLIFCSWRLTKSGTRAILPRQEAQAQSAAPVVQTVEERRPSLNKYHTILRETLETVFTTECIILTAYLETLIPFFYASYMLVMAHLPSAFYHTEMTAITQETVVSTVSPLLVLDFSKSEPLPCSLR